MITSRCVIAHLDGKQLVLDCHGLVGIREFNLLDPQHEYCVVTNTPVYEMVLMTSLQLDSMKHDILSQPDVEPVIKFMPGVGAKDAIGSSSQNEHYVRGKVVYRRLSYADIGRVGRSGLRRTRQGCAALYLVRSDVFNEPRHSGEVAEAIGLLAEIAMGNAGD